MKSKPILTLLSLILKGNQEVVLINNQTTLHHRQKYIDLLEIVDSDLIVKSDYIRGKYYDSF